MRNESIAAPLILFAIVASNAGAQSSAPAFELASIKPLVKFTPHATSPAPNNPRRMNLSNATLRLLIMRAYDVHYFQVQGPKWIDDQFYDITATLPEDSSRKQIPAMLDTLLQERFELKIHHEPHTEAVLTLRIANRGPKFAPADPTAEITTPAGNVVSRRIDITSRGHLEFKKTTMAQFAGALSNLTEHPVVDSTGLAGVFNIALDLDPIDLVNLRGPSAPKLSQPIEQSGPVGLSIVAALKELGLKLEAGRAPVDHIVVDQVTRIPTEN